MTKRRNDFLSLCLITAVEGGIGYWAEMKDYRWSEADNGLFTDASVSVWYGELLQEWTKVDLHTVSKGIAEIRSGEVLVSRQIVGWVVTSDNSNDANEIDAEAADCIVQAGLFGKLVYG